jgi:diaminopimelate decarboxylase
MEPMEVHGYFHYRNGELFCERVPLRRIAEEVGTPLFIYSHAHICDAVREYRRAFRGIPFLLCYAVKANANLAVLRLLGSLGCGAEVISGGELYRARQAGIEPSKIIFDGPGKSHEEIRYALKEGVLMFNVESEQELKLIDSLAGGMRAKARISLRVNPDVNPRTHKKIATGLKENKFGVSIDLALGYYKRAEAMDNLEVAGLHQHIGSQITGVGPYRDSVGKLVRLLEDLRSEGIKIKYLDIGGGPGIRYKKEQALDAGRLVEALRDLMVKADCKTIIEPGRSIVGNGGVMVTRLLYTKDGPVKNFYIVDAAMNDLIRPSLYDAYHQILAVELPADGSRKTTVDVVGPVCESGDCFAQDRRMPRMEPGGLLAVMSAGAYGFTMASNYNSRPRAAEVLVMGRDFHLIRRRESHRDLIRGEKIPECLQ